MWAITVGVGVFFLLYAAWASATGEMSCRSRNDFYRTERIIRRDHNPVAFRVLLLAVCALGVAVILMGVGQYLAGR